MPNLTKRDMALRMAHMEKALREAWIIVHVNHHRTGRYGDGSTIWCDMGSLTAAISDGLRGGLDYDLAPEPPSQEALRAMETKLDTPYVPRAELWESWHDIQETKRTLAAMPEPRDVEAEAKAACEQRGYHAWQHTYDHGNEMHCDDCGTRKPAHA